MTRSRRPASDAPAADAVKEHRGRFQAGGAALQSGIAKLEEAAKTDDSTIDPQTAATLEKNLDSHRSGDRREPRRAQSEPQSIAARDSLFDALRRKVALLQDTIALMNEMRKGNAAGAAQIVDGLNKS